MTPLQQTAVVSLEDRIQTFGDPVTMLRRNAGKAYPFPVQSEYTNWRDEQRAWREGVVMMDQSFHMTDFYFKGPDVQRLLSNVTVNSFKTFGKNKAKQLLAVTPGGHVISDGILFGLGEDEVSIVGRPPLADWVAYHAETEGYDVEITRDYQTSLNRGPRLTFRFQLQGPLAQKVIERAHGGPLEHIKFFNIGSFMIAGSPVRALNHTMSGVPGHEFTGLELWGAVEHRERVLNALLTAGQEFGMRQVGSRAYPGMALESGWIPSPLPAIYSGEAMRPYREWLGADSWEAKASLGGSFLSDNIEDYYQTPWDLGLQHLIKFDHDFIGRDALERRADQPKRQKVWLRWDDESVTDIFAKSLFGGEERSRYIEVPWGMYTAIQFDEIQLDGKYVGLSTTNGYTANTRSWISLAMVDEEVATDGKEVTVIWGEGKDTAGSADQHVRRQVRATIHTKPLI